jgi:hypothetical protein
MYTNKATKCVGKKQRCCWLNLTPSSGDSRNLPMYMTAHPVSSVNQPGYLSHLNSHYCSRGQKISSLNYMVNLCFYVGTTQISHLSLFHPLLGPIWCVEIHFAWILIFGTYCIYVYGLMSNSIGWMTLPELIIIFYSFRICFPSAGLYFSSSLILWTLAIKLCMTINARYGAVEFCSVFF